MEKKGGLTETDFEHDSPRDEASSGPEDVSRNADEYDDEYPNTDAHFAYPDTDGQYDAYPDTDAQYVSYPDTDAQYAAYPNTDDQYAPAEGRISGRKASGVDSEQSREADEENFDSNAEDTAAPARVMAPKFAKGDPVWYRTSMGDLRPAVVAFVDHASRVDGGEPSYTIRFEGDQSGAERSSVSERLRPRQPQAHAHTTTHDDSVGPERRVERSRESVASVRESAADAPSRTQQPASHAQAAAQRFAEQPAAPRARWRPPEWAKPALLHKPVLEMHTAGRTEPKAMAIARRPTTILGRNGQVSDIVIEEHSISRAHVAIINSSSATFLQDMHSAHGTWYDAEGRMLTVPQLGLRLNPDDPPVKLEEGATFRIGSSARVFRVTGLKTDTLERFQPPPWVEAPEIKCFFEIRANAFANPYLAHRYEEEGGDVDEELTLDKSFLIVGRSAQLCESVIRHESVSRQHAAILHSDGATYVQDLGTASGTYLNSKRVAANTPTKLKEGDVLSFGEAKATYTFRLDDSVHKTHKKRRTN